MTWHEDGIEFLKESGILDELMKDATNAIRDYIKQLEQRIDELNEELEDTKSDLRELQEQLDTEDDL